ncbi:carboxylating nicotinate-nucleotide diphosphorylase [Verrucomicrobiota bacterium sgz303538]
MSSQPAPGPSFDPIALALVEDLGPGDLTCRYFVDEMRQGKARIFAKQDAVVAGAFVAMETFRRVDPHLVIEVIRKDGDRVKPGDTVMEVRGPARSIFTGERVALNFLQRLSGVATLTRRFVDAVGEYQTRILDTRKTTPCLRALEKAAVVAGGGMNHRFGLFDMVMVKDNHLAAGASLQHLQESIRRLRRDYPQLRVELEADTLEQVRGFLGLEGVDVILLDNMSFEDMAEAVRLGAGRVQFEASGNVTLERTPQIAATGVDFISIGALTHSAPAIDFSLELLA